MTPAPDYVKRDSFNSASTEMLVILVKTTTDGYVKHRAQAELDARGCKE